MLALIPLLLPLITDIMGKVIPDVGARDKAVKDIELATVSVITQMNAAQVELNSQEAKHKSIFVAGWRPWIGWVLGAALAYQFLLSPLIMWGTGIAGLVIPPPPSLDANLWEILSGMMGMAGLRSFEKLKGIDTKTI